MEIAGHALQVEGFARRYYALFNERRLDEAELMVDRQAVFTYPAAKEHLIGRAGYRELARRWIDAFPDAHIAIAAVHVHGDTAATECVAEGTHLGTLELPGFPLLAPTGRRARLPVREVIVVREGLILRVRREFDPATLLNLLRERAAGLRPPQG